MLLESGANQWIPGRICLFQVLFGFHVLFNKDDTISKKKKKKVPGGNEGPGGVLVCSENYITWMNQDLPEVRVPIPRRKQYVSLSLLTLKPHPLFPLPNRQIAL